MKLWTIQGRFRMKQTNKQRIYPSSNQVNIKSLASLDTPPEEVTGDPVLCVTLSLDEEPPLTTKQSNDNDNNTDISSVGSSSSTTEPQMPAYLLHRNLVLGEGSYGQVCVALRGDANAEVNDDVRSASSNKYKAVFQPISCRRCRHRRPEKLACKCQTISNKPDRRLAKMLHEVKMMRALQGHEHIIELHDVFVENNELLIITALGAGGNLFNLIKTYPKCGFTEKYAAKTLAELLSALSFMHSRGICHRDVKLENCVLQTKKNVWSPLKLIDFGLATPFDPNGGKKLTRVVGSRDYRAPEVFQKSYLNSCDVWSVGVIAYVLLSGAHPFQGENDVQTKKAIAKGKYEFHRELFYDVGKDALDFVSSLMKYNASFRYTTEGALYDPWLTNTCDPTALHQVRSIATSVKQEEPQQRLHEKRNIYAGYSQDVFVRRRKLYDKEVAFQKKQQKQKLLSAGW